MMEKLLLLLTSKRTTVFAVLGAVLLWLTDASAVQAMQDAFGVSEHAATRVANVGKLLVAVLAAGGYSLLKRPPSK
jgi:hypothetical protein